MAWSRLLRGLMSYSPWPHTGFVSLGRTPTVGFSISMDSVEQIWWLAWAAHALPHVHQMFLADGQNVPYGQNFGAQGSMLALGVLFAPVTKLFGPIVTWYILLRLSIALSAVSMCFVLRRWTSWWPAAFFGGLLYAFCGYMSWLNLYPFLIFVPLPPLIFLLLARNPGATAMAIMADGSRAGRLVRRTVLHPD